MDERNPYQAPRSEVRDGDAVIDLRFRWKAVVFGALTDIGGSIVVGAAIFAILFAQASGGGASAEELMKSLGADPTYLLLSLVIGMLFSAVGGYVAGRVAGHVHIKHALVAGALSMALGALIGGDSNSGPYQGVMNLLGYGLHFPVVALGAWFAKRRAASQ